MKKLCFMIIMLFSLTLFSCVAVNIEIDNNQNDSNSNQEQTNNDNQNDIDNNNEEIDDSLDNSDELVNNENEEEVNKPSDDVEQPNIENGTDKPLDDNQNTGEDTNDTPVEDEEEIIEDRKVKAVWWWNDSLSDEYLEFANVNGINTIYYCSSKFNDETSSFIAKANAYNMDVYLLSGDYSWIENRTGLNNLLTRFEEYQIKYDNKFKGVHLDIEPHQHSEFNNKRVALIAGLIDIVEDLSIKDYAVEYDIPFWLDDEITRDGITKEAYKWIIDYADNITIMSYRDTKEAILDVAKDEYQYADSIDKGIMVSVETYSTEADFVSFYEEGKEIMIGIVNDIYQSEILGVNGIAIHHIQKWYEME